MGWNDGNTGGRDKVKKANILDLLVAEIVVVQNCHHKF